MSKIKQRKPKSLKKECETLWTEIIKRRAGYKSELSGVHGKQIGGETILTAHHIFGKPNYRLRYDLRNGICLDNHKEHIWGVHNKNNPSLANEYYNKILRYIGSETEEYLKSLMRFNGKTDLKLTKIYLEQELKKLERK